MAPQTRSATKHSPGRATRNSVFGRSPLPPPKSRNGPTNQAHDMKVDGRANVCDKKGTPWLACRDPYGVMTTVAVSDTGEGIHVRWYYPEDGCEVDEDEEAEVEMTVNEGRGITPVTTAGPGKAIRPPFPRTPMALQSYDAGSVIRTPIKRAQPLQRSPPRIGDKGIRCLYEKSGVLRELNGGARIVLRHPLGSTTNLSREQVERMEDEREEMIFQVQVEKLLAEKKRLEEEERSFVNSVYEDEMETDSMGDMDSASGFFRGPNGELLDHRGQRLLGREGTILIDSPELLPRGVMREGIFQSAEIVNHSNLDVVNEPKGLRRVGFGPEGTELID